MPYNIKSEEEYQQVMEKIESYLVQATKQGGFHTLSAQERDELQVLSKLAESWEDSIPLMPIKQPQTLVEMIELKMFERKLKQKDLAELLETSPSRLSEILTGKRQITLTMAKNLFKKLNIDPAFILEKA
jgi:HTH-type transcriptional regulator/antitoxin HigA